MVVVRQHAVVIWLGFIRATFDRTLWKSDISSYANVVSVPLKQSGSV